MNYESFEIVNVVGTGRMPSELDLEPLEEDLRGNAWSNESPQPGMHLRFEEDGPMTTFYRSGKYIIRAPSEQELRDAKAETCEEIARLGILEDASTDTDFDISNVVAVGVLAQESLNLIALTIGLGLKNAEYEPEQFPALTYRSDAYDCTFLVFANGKVVIAGASTAAEAKDSFDRFMQELDEWL
jgi:transcription initiation factor TFIID TATA-box-binding protein